METGFGQGIHALKKITHLRETYSDAQKLFRIGVDDGKPGFYQMVTTTSSSVGAVVAST